MAEDAAEGYVEHILEHFGSPLDGLRIAVDCANGAFSAIAPGVFERLGAEVTTVAAAPDGTNINVGCGATDLGLLQDVVRSGGYDLGVAFDGDGDRMLAVDETGAALDGDQILAVLALALGVDTVAVTTMTNLGFHRLMAERGHPRAHDRRRRPLRARGDAGRGRRARRRAVRPRDLARRSRDRRRAGRRAAPLPGARRRLARRRRRPCWSACPRRSRTSRWRGRGFPRRSSSEVDRLGDELAGRGRILVRPSGTEPVVRVLVEAESEEEARDLCGRVALLVRSELGQ